jgi:hypothetical protein
VIAIALGHALACMAMQAPEPVPIQRPAALEPTPRVPAPPAAEPSEAAIPLAPAPAPVAPAVPEPEPAPPEPEVGFAPLDQRPGAIPEGRIEGLLLDREQAGVPLPHTVVELSCTCLPATMTTVTDETGRYVAESLPPGVYTIRADRGGPPTRQVFSLGLGQFAQVDLTLAPPTSSATLERRAADESRARTMLALGGVAVVGSIGLLIAASVEKRKPECNFGLDDCAAAPRHGLATTLGITGGLFAAGGAALIGVGAHRLRKLRAAVAIEDGEVALLVSGRF